MKEDKQYLSSRPYLRKLDEFYLVVVTGPILFFFVYYLYFLNEVKEYEIIPKEYTRFEIMVPVMVFSLALVAIHIYKFVALKRMRTHSDFYKKLNLTKAILKKVMVVELLLFILAIFLFFIADNQWMSIASWLMFGAMSFEKPSVYRLARHIKFKNKEGLNLFINDEPFERIVELS